MKSFFTEDFFKNVIGFTTMLTIGIIIIGIAGYSAPSDKEVYTAETTRTAESQ